MNKTRERLPKVSGASSFDGRFVAVLVMTIYFVVLAVGGFIRPLAQVWHLLGVPALSPSFSDARSITEGEAAYRNGIDPLAAPVPGDPWHRPMNYPRIWLGLAWLGVDEKNTSLLAILWIAFFWGSALALAGRIDAKEGACYGIFLCSPCAMLAAERGNNDLLIFSLVAAAVLFLKRRWSFAACLLIFFAALLKLYPIAAICSALGERKRRALSLIAGAFLLFLAYISLTWRSVVEIARSTPRPADFGYGRFTLFDLAGHYLRHKGIHLPHLLFSSIALAALVAALAIAYLLARRWRIGELGPSTSLDSFRAGASIYLCTFVIGNNWNYRLIFLLLLLPQLFAWSKASAGQADFLRFLSKWLLAGVFGMVWLPWFQVVLERAGQAVLPIKEIVSWALFLSLTFLLLATTPEWTRRWIGIPDLKSA